ncbi:GntR family transcriptional regulator [Streptomyces luteocolor]|uniref:GntR family transcriptional regulator n=1 Tax=Streptomyces luteocolor TaxID=285500 RepID=UPI0008530DD6|nr:UTRA domain-containing protein [Streptomyces luteocolor]
MADDRIIRTSPQRISREVWESGRAIQSADVAGQAPDVTGVRVDETPAPEHIAQALGIDTGTSVVRRSRTYEIDDQVVQMATSYLPLDLAHGTAITQIDTGPGGTYARLAELGHAPARFAEDVTVRPATIDESDQLGLRACEPIIHIVRTASDATRRVVEVNDMVLHPQRYRLRYEFGA